MAEIDINTRIIVAIVICVFISIAFYNVLELTVSIFTSFKRRSGLYFWSILIATWGIAFNGTGYLLRHLSLTTKPIIYATLILIGWCAMITGQSVVLYSRLHIVVHDRKRLRLVLYMIIADAIWLHIPIIILVYGVNSANPEPFQNPYTIFEKIQLTVFFVQEIIISALYVWETTKRLRLMNSIGDLRTRKIMNHLIWVNILVVLLDVTILALEFTNLYDIQTAWKPLVYSIKLKLEFSILNRLVELTRGASNSSAYVRSQGLGQANDVALETYNGERSRQFTQTDEPEYEVRIGKGDRNHVSPATSSYPTKTTEITIQTHSRANHGNRDSDNISEDPDKEREGDVCSTSSEVQFARY
ncbi:integral membrane protein [Colletotrichum asianum]|uniref:Integral membrane protein n=1 Tax=Colletotrichum asianum TaxID=702518 RepID=A0A8H3W4P0_9PEZI|nr:integral membrane protein [Colletotrichum asianum]